MSHNDEESPIGLEATDVLPPARLIAGKYRLGRLLGEGGMGAVYEAEHTGLGTMVAVKLLNESFMTDANALSRFRREARATAAIRHDNIVAVYDTGTDEQGLPFIVMEQLDGESLSAYLRRERRLSPEVATAICLQILAGLAAAHEKTIIHRDLKPGNVLLAKQPDGTQLVKVLDFGISKYYSDPGVPDVTATGAVIGTPRFMAPEQARGDRDIDARIDLYAVGVLLYRMVTAKLPFSGHDQREIIERILEGNPQPPHELEPSIPPALEAVIVKALAVDREERHQSAREMMDELIDAMPELGSRPIRIRIPTSNFSTITNRSQAGPSIPSLVGVAPSVDTRPDSAQAMRRERTLARQRLFTRISALLLALVVVAGGVYFALRRDTGDPRPRPKVDNPTPYMAGTEFPGKPIRFGITRYLPKVDLVKEHAALIGYLAKSLKRPVKLEVLDGYINLAEKLSRGELELGALAAYAYVRAHRKHPELKLIATHVTSSGSSYDGFIVAKAESSYRSLKDLKGKVFCYVSHTSTSGYLYPRAEFRRNGIDPDTAFKSTQFAGDHLTALRMVYDGACDAAAVFTGMLYEAKKHGMPPERFKVLLQTPRIPYDAYCVSQQLSAKLTEKIRAALLALKARSPLARSTLGENSRLQGFVPAKDSDYAPVRKIEKFLDHADAHGHRPAGPPSSKPTAPDFASKGRAPAKGDGQ